MKIDHTQLTVRQPDSGNDRPRQWETDPLKPAGSIQSSISLGTGRCVALRSRRDSSQQDRLQQADRREVQKERVSQLSCKSPETRCSMERPSRQSHRDAERKPHFRQQVQDESDRHAVTLDEKDDQKIFQDGSSLQRMRRLILGRCRGPGSIACWDTRKIKNTGAIG